MPPIAQNQFRLTVLSLVVTSFLFFILARNIRLSPSSLGASLSFSPIKSHRSLRRWAFNSDPKTTITKVSKIVHFTVADDPPAYQTKVIEYSTRVIESHGFKVMVHRDSDCENLILASYRTLIPSWQRLKANQKADKGARKADFVRVLILYHYGGIYLDGDMLSCKDLGELVDTPGMASFPLVLPTKGHIVNAVMAGPSGHLIWKIAIVLMCERGDKLVEEYILDSTGATLIAKAFDTYYEVINVKPPIRFSDKLMLPEPEGGSKWLTAGDARLGAVKRGGMDSSRGIGTARTIGLVHLHWRSWMEYSKFAESECNTKYDLIDPFLDYACRHVQEEDSRFWSECGSLQE